MNITHRHKNLTKGLKAWQISERKKNPDNQKKYDNYTSGVVTIKLKKLEKESEEITGPLSSDSSNNQRWSRGTRVTTFFSFFSHRTSKLRLPLFKGNKDVLTHGFNFDCENENPATKGVVQILVPFLAE